MNLSLTDLLGYAAAGLVLATFSFRSITALRSVAIASNLMFIAYAAFAQLAPVLILHALLLPLNMLRLYEARAEAAPHARHGMPAANRAARCRRRRARPEADCTP